MSEFDDSNPGLVEDSTEDNLIKTNQKIFRELLAEYSEQCPSCGYDLHQLTEMHCPECGQKLTLRIELVTPKLASFIVGIVGLAGGMGFSGLLLAYFSWMFVFVRSLPMSKEVLSILGILAVEFLVSGIILFLWYRYYGTIRRMQSRKRWILALLCLTLPFVNLLIFSIQLGN